MLDWYRSADIDNDKISSLLLIQPICSTDSLARIHLQTLIGINKFLHLFCDYLRDNESVSKAILTYQGPRWVSFIEKKCQKSRDTATLSSG